MLKNTLSKWWDIRPGPHIYTIQVNKIYFIIPEKFETRLDFLKFDLFQSVFNVQKFVDNEKLAVGKADVCLDSRFFLSKKQLSQFLIAISILIYVIIEVSYYIIMFQFNFQTAEC